MTSLPMPGTCELDAADLDLLIRELVTLRHQSSALSGAAVGLLHEIHKAGGWNVFDPGYQAPIARAIQALEDAAHTLLHSRHTLPKLPLGPSGMVYEGA